MTIRFNNRLLILSVLLLMLTAVLSISAANAEPLEEQRKQYQSAKKVLRAGELTKFRNISASLVDYPLYPYLMYDYLSPRLSSLKDEDITDFIKQYHDSPLANDLRKTWLRYLAQRGRWQIFLENYTPQADTVLQCQQLLARIRTGNIDDGLYEDIKKLWLVGKSQSDQCDPAFEVLYKSDHMTAELVWERIGLAIQNNQTSLARYLGRRLDDSGQPWVERWITAHHTPARITRDPEYDDTPLTRNILLHGITRQAVTDITTAIPRWDELKSAYNFNEEQTADVERTLAIRAVLGNHPRSREILDSFDNQKVDESLFHWRLRNALENRDWASLVKWTEGEPKDKAIRLRWHYWRARALEKTGNTESAMEIYRGLARERDYYGFLAADRLSVPYTLAHQVLAEDPETWTTVSQLGGVKRARELYLIGNRYPARREWNHLLLQLTPYEMQIAAAITAEWGWHDRAILTLGRAQAYDDLILRFPIVYEKELSRYAMLHKLDLAWVYALTRAESAFMTDARSPTGALGLMQVMPATGRETARAIGLQNFSNTQLYEADKNITIGTAYLKKVYDRFDNRILATAAYNAGPNAVARWLSRDACAEPDIWVEKIPFTETRKYVARIMFYSTVYDWRLNNEIIRVSERMEPAISKPQNIAANLTCSIPNISRL